MFNAETQETKKCPTQLATEIEMVIIRPLFVIAWWRHQMETFSA